MPDQDRDDAEARRSGEVAGAGDPTATQRFRRVAGSVLDAILSNRPEAATDLGDHRFDDRLTDWSPAGVAAAATALGEALAALDAVDDTGLAAGDRVDLEMLRTAVTGGRWSLTELRRHEHDPLLHLPGDAIYPLIAREVGEPADRLRALAARLTLLPGRLATAREVLHEMPRVHVETAIGQTRGIVGMLGAPLEPLLASDPALAAELEPARQAADRALSEHADWLEAQLPVSDADPRLGEQAYAAQLWYTLDTETGPDALLTRAESDLQAIEEEIAELASTIAGAPARPGQVREVLDQVAASAPVDDGNVLSRCEQALEAMTARVRALDLVTLPDAAVQIIVMPESRRGVAVAYCDPPGALEPGAVDGSLPTFFAVSPTPLDWEPDRVASFYREYNGHMLRNLTAHEAMPGHVVQLAHAARYTGSTRVRAAIGSGPFIEGWAVYAEEVVAAAGLGVDPAADAALRMQRLKMQLRTTINAILDVRVHSRGMTQDEAIRLMIDRGHQEDGEAAGKWRRAQLTSAQLSTYYVGYREVSDIVRLLRERQPTLSDRELHDRVLAHGSPPPRHLRTLLGLG